MERLWIILKVIQLAKQMPSTVNFDSGMLFLRYHHHIIARKNYFDFSIIYGSEMVIFCLSHPYTIQPIMTSQT